jgi:uncharacterized protein YecT (DUF1311 family)
VKLSGGLVLATLLVSLSDPAPVMAGVNCQSPLTQADINTCAAITAKEADQALNQAYQQLKASLSPPQDALLVAAQLAWIRFRDTHCELERSFEAGGSLSTTSHLECVRRMSSAREKELRALQQARPGLSQSTQPQASQSQNTLIGTDHIGVARIGMTLAQLRQRLDPQSSMLARRPFMVDVESIPIARQGVVQFHVLVPAGTNVSDATVIAALLTTNPAFRTREGVGPGLPLREAARLYGQPTLGYNTSNESRETVTFNQQPSRQIRFGVKGGATGLAGVYPLLRREYRQTQRYHPSASISYVLVGAP